MPSRPRIRRMRAADREAVLDRLSDSVLNNLLLIDAALRLGRRPAPGEPGAELLLAERDGELIGVASLQPQIAIEHGLERAAFAELIPYFSSVSSGLIKAPTEVAERLWAHLQDAGRRKALDRVERGYVVEPERLRGVHLPEGGRVRNADYDDLSDLVDAARLSLREEDRPDPFRGDPNAFRSWVAARIPRARVVECEGEFCFVGYADVQCDQGWLLQGVYTLVEQRRRGYAAAGVTKLCQIAFETGANHVQLAVVEGNRPAIELYERLGFRAFDRFRTILFS